MIMSDMLFAIPVAEAVENPAPQGSDGNSRDPENLLMPNVFSIQSIAWLLAFIGLSFISISSIRNIEGGVNFSLYGSSSSFSSNGISSGQGELLPRLPVRIDIDRPAMPPKPIISHHRRLEEVYNEGGGEVSPFMSDFCLAMLEDTQLVEDSPQPISVVIVARNEPKDVLLQTVNSVVKNSIAPELARSQRRPNSAGSVELLDVVIVDDFSDSPISDWPEWTKVRRELGALHPGSSRRRGGSGSGSGGGAALTFVRLTSHRGPAFAKNKGAQTVWDRHQSKDKTPSEKSKAKAKAKTPEELVLDKLAVLFLDAHVLVSPMWLVPLASTISRYPKAMVYPVIDVLTAEKDGSQEIGEREGLQREYGIVKADDVLAGFDWTLRPRWEPISQAVSDAASARIKAGISSADIDTTAEVVSPAAPGIFAMRLAYFRELGTFDEALFGSYYAQEALELSLRAWLCGGVVLRQSCSRVAHLTPNMFHDSPAGQGATQASVDHSTMLIAQKWMEGNLPSGTKNGGKEGGIVEAGANVLEGDHVRYKEIVYQARFLHRIPYFVDLGSDPIKVTPPQASSRDVLSDGPEEEVMTCLSFQWYLEEVYPGLLQEASSVQALFAQYLGGGEYLTAHPMISTLLREYAKEGGAHASAEASDAEIQRLKQREASLVSNARWAVEIGGDATPGGNGGHYPLKHQFIEPPAPKGPNPKELLDQHAARVRDQLLCEDYKGPVGAAGFSKSCAQHQKEALAPGGDANWCQTHKADVVFHCPHTCGFCDVVDNQFCEDFYLMKCPKWMEQGKCGTQDRVYGAFNDVCRKSCGVCHSKADVVVVAQDEYHGEELPRGEIRPERGTHNPPVLPTGEEPVDPIQQQLHGPMTVDPTLLHREYLEGNVPDKPTGGDQCQLKGKPEGNMLSRIPVADMEGPTHKAHGSYLDSNGKPLRIFCGIYTMEKNHGTNVEATRSTWAKRCDGFIAFSTVEDPKIPSVNILHEGDEAYDNMWQKSRSIWRYIHNHMADDYDFFLLGGDDMFYIIENLRAYLGSEEITRAREEQSGLYIGRIFQPPKQLVFNSGGAGYLLDRKALKVLGRNIDGPKCFPHQRGFWEDVNVANCLKSSDEHIVPYQTRDPQERERFHPFTPGMHLTYRIPKNPDWYAKYNPGLKIGYDCCSDESISFHYVAEKLMYKLYNFLYHCDSK